jgi:hypothetical protein
MATSDIAKEAVFDDRIVQPPPAFGVNKGALSLTAVPYIAISATTSQHTYNINVPSQNIFCARDVDWTSTCPLAVNVGPITVPLTVNQPVLTFGQDCALTNFPLHSLVGTMTATINDTTVTMNTSDILKQVLRLTSYAENKKSRTCPTMDDTYQSYNAAYGAFNSPLNGYADSVQPGWVPNGAFPLVVFCDSTGAVLPVSSSVGTYTTVVPGTSTPQTVSYVNGVPIRTAANDPNGYSLFMQFTSTEKLVLSPFIFANAAAWEGGLFGINAIQIVCNMVTPGRVLRSTTQNGRTITSVNYNGNNFTNSRMLFQFLTPSIDLPLPPKSAVEYMEYPRYITNFSGLNTAAGAEETLVSQTIVLPQIPDMLLIFCRPPAYTNALGNPDTTQADWMFPPVRISINFDNFAGLLSSHQQVQLYQMAVHNGLDMDYAEWIGSAKLGRTGGNVSTVGGFLVLKPGTDITLQSGQAPGLAGSFTLQYSLTVQNNTAAVATQYQIVTVAVNGGFFESQSGSSRVVKSVLSEADIISAPATTNTENLRRLVGHGFLSNLGSAASKAYGVFKTGRDLYEKSKPLGSAIKALLPAGKAKDVASALGYGSSGGGGVSGGRSHKSLASRLM